MARQKLYSIGELISENIKLKRDMEKMEIRHLKGCLSLVKMFKEQGNIKPFNIEEYQKALELQLAGY
jgi:hypothetical protein